MVREAIDIPLLAAGGIATGKAILAVEALGADGAQIGTRFAISEESSAHDAFKQRVAQASEGDTILTLKQLTPVSMIKNKFYERVAEAERRGATQQELNAILGKRRSRLGIFEGDLDEGELEIGQVAGAVGQIRPAADILKDLWNEYSNAKQQLCNGANSD
jgi:enoyl-[acyl-carrier protein] reductase II